MVQRGRPTNPGDDVDPGRPVVHLVGAERADQAARSNRPPQHRMAMSGAQATLDVLSRLGVVDAWAVSRLTERSWTSLALQATPQALARGSEWAGSRAATYLPGTPVPREQTLAHHLITGPGPVAVSDLSRCEVPGVPQLARTWGFGAFLGIALIGPDGRLLGALEAMSVRPVEIDIDDWSLMLMSQGRAIESVLYADFASLGERRRALHRRAMQTADRTTGLPDRRGWGVLLTGEEELTTPLGCPAGIVLVDLGVVRTARAMRRAVSVVTAAVQGSEVVRVGPRQLGVIAGGQDYTAVEEIATVVQHRLEGGGFRTVTAFTMRAGLEALSCTWLRAEHALITARRERSRQTAA